MKYDIFISYSRADLQIVDKFVSQLENAGYKIWIDREGIYCGDQFKETIVDAIIGSSIFIFFSSAKANESKWTEREISIAYDQNKKVLPVKLDDTKYTKSVYFDLVNTNFIQYQQNQFSATLERLKEAIAKCMEEINSPNSAKNNHSPEESFLLGLSSYIIGNYQQAVDSFRYAAQHGHHASQYYLGVCYGYGQGVPLNYQEAIKWHNKAAQQGYAPSQLYLAMYYAYGYGVDIDYHESFKWYQKAGELGDAMGQYYLGNCYEYGHGVLQNYPEAIKWYRKAAQQGHILAQKQLGLCYTKNQGVPQNLKEAAKWFQKAAQQGDDESQNHIGNCYEFGHGVKQDLKEAAKWYQKAAKHGNSIAIDNLKRISQYLE